MDFLSQVASAGKVLIVRGFRKAKQSEGNTYLVSEK